MRRREFIIVLAGAAAASPFVARAQRAERTRQIGVLMLYPENDPQGQLRAAAFRRELEKAGWTVGGNLQIDYHWGTGDADWVRSATAQMLGQAPDVMLANGDAAVKAAQQSTRTVPVIFIAGGDPVGDGWVQSLAHPGGNLTGFAVMEPSLGAKLLGLLKQITPRVARVAILVNPDNVTHQRILALVMAAAPRFAVEVVAAPAREPAEIEAAMTQWGREFELRCDRAVGSFDQLSPQTHRRVGGTSSAAGNLCIAQRHRRWRPHVLRRRHSRSVSTGGNICRSHP